jgi:hypothetical protein
MNDEGERVERHRQADAAALEISFLQGPDLEEAPSSKALWKRAHARTLGGAKVALNDVERAIVIDDLFDVDSYVVLLGYGARDAPGRVRDVEA